MSDEGATASNLSGVSGSRPKTTLRTVEQAARVLDFVARNSGGVGLSATARELGIPKANLHRILQTWVRVGFVQQNSDARYRLGWKLFELTAQHAENLDLREMGHPYLIQLGDETGDTVHMSVIDEDEVLYVDKVEGRQAIRVYTAVGRRAPIHATSSGKAMLAFMPDDYLERLAASTELTKFTETTIASLGALRRVCEEIRGLGYAVNRGEWHSEVAGVGVPIFDAHRTVIAAFSVTLPKVYFTDQRLRELAGLLASAAADFSRRLGYVRAAV